MDFIRLIDTETFFFYRLYEANLQFIRFNLEKGTIYNLSHFYFLLCRIASCKEDLSITFLEHYQGNKGGLSQYFWSSPW